MFLPSLLNVVVVVVVCVCLLRPLVDAVQTRESLAFSGGCISTVALKAHSVDGNRSIPKSVLCAGIPSAVSFDRRTRRAKKVTLVSTTSLPSLTGRHRSLHPPLNCFHPLPFSRIVVSCWTRIIKLKAPETKLTRKAMIRVISRRKTPSKRRMVARGLGSLLWSATPRYVTLRLRPSDTFEPGTYILSMRISRALCIVATGRNGCTNQFATSVVLFCFLPF